MLQNDAEWLDFPHLLTDISKQLKGLFYKMSNYFINQPGSVEEVDHDFVEVVEQVRKGNTRVYLLKIGPS